MSFVFFFLLLPSSNICWEKAHSGYKSGHSGNEFMSKWFQQFLSPHLLEGLTKQWQQFKNIGLYVTVCECLGCIYFNGSSSKHICFMSQLTMFKCLVCLIFNLNFLISVSTRFTFFTVEYHFREYSTPWQNTTWWKKCFLNTKKLRKKRKTNSVSLLSQLKCAVATVLFQPSTIRL